MARRVVTKGSGRRTVASKSATELVDLDDRPLSLKRSRDGKRVVVCLPYEAWVVNLASLVVEKTIELTVPRPTVFEANEDGVLWFGGSHLHRGSLWNAATTKVGTKLGGVVDHVCVVGPRLLCGVGAVGEVLWDTEKEAEVHRRKVSERDVHALAASADGRAVFADGSPHVWVIDPDHPSGYMKLKFKHTSEVDQEHEGIVAVHVDGAGRCLLGARDGGVAWTSKALRVVEERFVPKESQRPPLALDSDETWVYVLRTGGILDRFALPHGGDEDDDRPPAQTVRLERTATCMVTGPSGTLVLAGPQSDDQLGRLWTVSADTLDWQPLQLLERSLIEDAKTDEDGPKKPDFTQVRSKLSGPAVSSISVDAVISATPAFWVTRDTGTILERPTATMDAADVLPADALLLPAMFRLREGTARPGLVLWPGAPKGRRRGDTQLLTWGDDPRQWLSLDTPSIRKQGWSRRDVFPLQVALRAPTPEVAGHRPRIPGRWVDAELFDALVKECKTLLKVLW
ncbi:MAG: hypothetical protein ACE37F_05720 [Nannocystaceae bacterium]|nr:hypothetical protein [bacterium]